MDEYTLFLAYFEHLTIKRIMLCMLTTIFFVSE